MKKLILSFAAVILTFTGSALAATQGDKVQPKQNDIVDTAVSAKVFTTLVAAVKAADLVDVLKSKGPFTVFAPTDDAFKKLPEGTIANLLKPENKDMLISILKYHVVSGKVLASDVVKLNSATTVEGQDVSIKVMNGSVFLNGSSKVLKTDIAASNGVIHVIDTVLMPPMKKNIVETAVSTNMFNTLVAAVKAAGLAETLMGDGPFTVLAPTDEAFKKLACRHR